MDIAILLCGGTIEKTYSETLEKNIFSADSEHVVEKIISDHIRPRKITLSFQRIMQKDSFEVHTDDRVALADACALTKQNNIIITHGTSTLTQSAELLMTDTRLLNKTIICTGAMRPYSLGGNTDAVANLSSALTAAQILTSGVYIAMNGSLFRAGAVRKDEKNGRFEAL